MKKTKSKSVKSKSVKSKSVKSKSVKSKSVKSKSVKSKSVKQMKGNGKRKFEDTWGHYDSDSESDNLEQDLSESEDEMHQISEAQSSDSDEEIPFYEKSFAEDVFIHLGKTHIMGEIDWVSYSALLNKDGCNIFIMAEKHNPRNNNCTGILETFKNLLQDWSKIKPTFPIDLMIEMPQTEYVTHTLQNRTDYSLLELHQLIDDYTEDRNIQMYHVRKNFGVCANKNCKPLKVHWIDSAGIIDGKITESIETPTVRTEIPWWIYKLEKYASEVDDGFTDVQLSQLYVDKENTIPFQLIDDKDLINLLINQPIIRKEMRKSSLSIDFAVKFIQTIIDKPYKSFGTKAFYVWRATIDVYTVARILSQHMKNVIIYVGWVHSDNICNMFQQLGFTIDKKQGNPKCNQWLKQ